MILSWKSADNVHGFQALKNYWPHSETMTYRNRSMAFGGYLLQAVEGERRYKIVNFKHVRLIMTEDEQNELEGEDLFDIDEYMYEESDLFDSTSKSFLSIFLQSPNCFMNSPSLVSPKRFQAVLVLPAKRSAKLNLSFSIMYKNNKKKYVRYSDALGDLTFTNLRTCFLMLWKPAIHQPFAFRH